MPIYYEMRDARMRVHGVELESAIRRSFPELSDEEIRKLKRGTRLQEKVAGAEERVRMICRDILQHYRETIEPNGFKAQIVTVSRDVAVTYVETLRDLGAPECAVIMSTANNDSARLQRQMRRKIKEHLRAAQSDFPAMEASTAKIMDVARARLTK